MYQTLSKKFISFVQMTIPAKVITGWTVVQALC